MWFKAKAHFLIAGVAGAVLLLCWGCEESQKAVELYLDGVLLTEYDRDAEAVAKLREAVKIDKNFAYAYSVLGDVYEKLEDYPKSAESYERAAQINPDSPKDYLNLGRVYRIHQDRLIGQYRWIHTMAGRVEFYPVPLF